MDRREQAIELRKAGLSMSQIATAMGVSSTGTLTKWLKGVPAPEWTARPRAKDALRERAIELRLRGKSYREIREELDVSKGSLSLWLRDIPLTDIQRERLKALQLSAVQKRAESVRANRIRRQNATISGAKAEIGDVANRELFMAGVALYWAEGTKTKPWNPGEKVVFINSDAGVIRVFVAWLGLLGVGLDRLTLRISIHETADLVAAHCFWSDVVGIRVAEFKSPTIKRHKPKTNRKNVGEDYHGCLVVTVRRSTELYRRIAGWWAGLVDGAAQVPSSMSGPSGVV